ncbi:MAG: hypothetical protein RR371_06175 [Bacteroides sp.]
MSQEQMEAFLDSVLLTGLNTGTYAASLDKDSEEYLETLDTNPYDAEWLSEEAEEATALVFADDGDLYLPNALCEVIFKTTGITPDKED